MSKVRSSVLKSVHDVIRISIFVAILLPMLTSCDSGLVPTNRKKPSSSTNVTHGSNVDKKSNQIAIRIEGNKFISERGEVLHLHGVSIMGMEYAAVAGFSPSDPFPTLVESTWASLHEWHVNIIRIPLNEISYLGLKCLWPFSGPAFNKPGDIREADPGNNYKKRLKEVIDRATADKLYIILDLHTTAPDDAANAADGVRTQCAYELNPLPDADHAIDFWKDLASAYKHYPNVMFELFNDPYIDQWQHFSGDKIAAWKALRDGTQVNSYLPLWPTPEKHFWHSAGMQQLVDTVRATGATNVILQSGLSRSADLELWLTYKANDPLKQTAAVWHAFPPKDVKWGDKCYSYPAPWCDERSYSYANAILAANYPVMVTEFSDKNTQANIGAPFASSVLPHLDDMGISYLGWSFVADTQAENVLIRDNLGTPSDGYGEYVKAHYLCLTNININKSCSSTMNTASQNSKSIVLQPTQSVTRGWAPLASPI